jgi:hypothetical protein
MHRISGSFGEKSPPAGDDQHPTAVERYTNSWYRYIADLQVKQSSAPWSMTA